MPFLGGYVSSLEGSFLKTSHKKTTESYNQYKSPNGWLDLWIQIPNVTLPILSNIPPFDLTAGGWSKVTPKDRSHLDMYIIVFQKKKKHTCN